MNTHQVSTIDDIQEGGIFLVVFGGRMKQFNVRNDIIKTYVKHSFSFFVLVFHTVITVTLTKPRLPCVCPELEGVGMVPMTASTIRCEMT